MKLSEAGNAAVVVDVGDETISVPVYPVSEVVNWCGEIDRKRQEQFDARAERLFPDEEKRFHYLTSYAPFPADEEDVQNLAAHTPAGTLRVAAFCLPLATVTARGGSPLTPREPLAADRVKAVIDGNRVAGLRPLVRQLVGLPAVPPKPPPKPPAEKPKDQKEGDNPLPQSASGLPTTPPAASEGQPGTGQPTSPSSPPPTPANPSPAAA